MAERGERMSGVEFSVLSAIILVIGAIGAIVLGA